MRTDDFRAIAQGATRDGFISMCRFCFLMAKGELRPPTRPRQTQSLSAFDPGEFEATVATDVASHPTSKGARPSVLAIRKVQDTFPDMITVGRTGNNDVVVADVSVSRFHAFFQLRGDEVALADAGSRNGTTIDGEPLEPRGPGTVLESGSVIGFGHTEFLFLDAGDLWDHLRGK
jgi:hypothetical protein